MFHDITNFLVQTIGTWGYIGVFALMFLESTFFPFPSEVVLIPAGYLAFKGDMDLYFIILIASIGSLLGALLNYYLSKYLGRKLILKYGHYIYFTEEKLKKLEIFFKKYGEISTFNGRLIPGVRQYISIPAGLSNMNILKFSIYTTVGASIWASILTFLGYFIGNNQDLVSEYLRIITISTIILVVIISFIYIKIKK